MKVKQKRPKHTAIPATYEDRDRLRAWSKESGLKIYWIVSKALDVWDEQQKK